jgi:hypothetical protein
MSAASRATFSSTLVWFLSPAPMDSKDGHYGEALTQQDDVFISLAHGGDAGSRPSTGVNNRPGPLTANQGAPAGMSAKSRTLAMARRRPVLLVTKSGI